MENLSENNKKELEEETEISKDVPLENEVFYCPICKQANLKAQKEIAEMTWNDGWFK